MTSKQTTKNPEQRADHGAEAVEGQARVELNLDQAEALINAIEIPARLCDRHGAILVQNRPATAIDAAARWDEAQRLEQPGGCTLLLLHPQPRKLAAPTPLEDIGTLANGMAHSIRNPLSSIITAASLVNDDPNVSEETTMLLGVITRESRHLNQILTDFLSYVRPHPSQISRFELCDTLRAAVRLLRQEGHLAAGVTVQDDLPGDLWVEGDEEQMRQALVNIVRNAVEAMREGGTLTLQGRIGDGGVTLEIGDTGRGLSEKEMARAFEPFFSNTAEGTGLGLTVARATVSAMGGSISIENKTIALDESTERGGARVVFQLPPAPVSA